MWPVIIAVRSEDTRWILVSCAILALLIIVGGLGVWYYRKRVLFSEEASADGMWTFDDLRRMRDRGDLTEEEYQSLRAALIGSFQGKVKKDPSPAQADVSPKPGDAES